MGGEIILVKDNIEFCRVKTELHTIWHFEKCVACKKHVNMVVILCFHVILCLSVTAIANKLKPQDNSLTKLNYQPKQNYQPH